MRKLNPDTIESVSILKDKTALQLYGEKGKNGVILVKLKPPEKTEMPVVVITDNLKIPAADTNFFVNCRCRCSSKDILNALIIIDGKESAESELRALNPDRIESFSVLKDETAINLYGEKGKNGVILIGLKDGLSIPDYRIRQGNTGYQE
jgi:TonB-dependent SusC/RagA subfamily outer membrane receptor